MSESINPDFERYKNDVRKWEIDYQQSRDWELESFKSLIQFSLVVLRGIVPINGGAAIAFLTFMGHFVSGSSPQIVGVADVIVWSMGSFLFGTVCGVAAAASSYLAQSHYTKRADRRGKPWHWIAIILASGGLVAFCAGASVAAVAFSQILSA